MDVKVEYKFQDYTQIEFYFKNKKAIALLPKEDVKNGETVIKTEYFAAFPELQNEMVKRGFTVVFIENRNRWGTDQEIEDQYEFINYVSKELGISSKVITIGMSCGGMMSILLASKHPEIIKALYLDAPVVNFLSCPARLGVAYDVTDGMWTEFERAWKMTKSELLTFRKHPLDMIPTLIKNKIKIYMAYGDSDNTVPYSENGACLEHAYKENGLEDCILIDKKVGVDHHPHGPTDINKAINFLKA